MLCPCAPSAALAAVTPTPPAFSLGPDGPQTRMYGTLKPFAKETRQFPGQAGC